MQFAVLGTDPDVMALLAAAISLGHEIVWLGEVRPEDAEAVARLVSPSLAPSTDWEMLLDQATADAVLVGRGTASPELRAEQLKRLATDAVPLLVVHPACESVLIYYEVDMIRRETRCLVRHYNPLVGLAVIHEMAEWVRGGHPQVGPIHQVSCERQTLGGQKATVLYGLARDVELLLALAGDIRKVSAFGPQTAEASFASLQVQMTTANPAPIRWSVAPQAGRESGIELTLVRDHGFFKLHLHDRTVDRSAAAGQFEDVSDGQRQVSPLPPFNAPVAAIEELVAAVAETDPRRRAAASTWDRATQAMEVVDAIELSLQKGRTIEVHQQQLTEQLAFRGTMAALGCGLLLVGLVVFVFAGLLGGIETVVRQPLVPYWPLILLAVLAFFLLLQAIPLLLPKRHRDEGTAEDVPKLS
jgi:predicted dehydrogenase